jgi:hypothetical protein
LEERGIQDGNWSATQVAQLLVTDRVSPSL